MFFFQSASSVELFFQLTENFFLWNAHLNEVTNHVKRTLNGTRIKVRIVGNLPGLSQDIKSICDELCFISDAWSIDMSEGDQCINAGSHDNSPDTDD
jgi:hypothetical protein